MKTKQIELYNLRHLITKENARRFNTGKVKIHELLGEYNRDWNTEEGIKAYSADHMRATDLLRDALKRLHGIQEKKQLALAAAKIAAKLLEEYSYDAMSSQEDGGELCDNENDWSVIQVNEGLDIDAQNADYIIERLKEMVEDFED